MEKDRLGRRREEEKGESEETRYEIQNIRWDEGTGEGGIHEVSPVPWQYTPRRNNGHY